MKRILGRKIAHRRSMLRNLATSLVLYEKVDTTLQKAKETKAIFEGIISDAKPADLNAYKKISSYLFDIKATRKVRDELVPRYKDRKSGFVRFYRLPNRLGDNSKMARLELIDRKVFVIEKKRGEPKADEDTKEKLTKSDIKAQKRIDKLSATENRGGVNTSIRTKASRKTGI
jgi:large subunit ribosomal protein L17